MQTKDKLKMYRKKRGLTQKQLGELTGLNEATIRKYEIGDRKPKLENLTKILNALEIKIEDSFGEMEVPLKSKIIKARHLTNASVDEVIENSGISENKYLAFEEGTEVPTDEELAKIFEAMVGKKCDIPSWVTNPEFVSEWDYKNEIALYEKPPSEVKLMMTTLVYHLEKLNEQGLEKALDFIQILGKVKEYQK